MSNKEENLIDRIIQEMIKWAYAYNLNITHKELLNFLKTAENELPRWLGQTLQKELKTIANESYKDGYNKRLKDEGKIGERWQHLYL